MFVRQLAFILGLIMCTVVNADEITPHTAHEGMLRPADAQLTNYTFWQPEIDGLARYRLHLPPRGIEDANKYQDTAALYYLAQQIDRGLHVIGTVNDRVAITIKPQNMAVKYSRGIAPNFSYSIGLITEDNQLLPALSVTTRRILHDTTLEHYEGSLVGSTPSLGWSRTVLNYNERAEDLWSARFNNQQSSIAYGRRWFTVFNDANLLAELSIRSGQGVLGIQLEQSSDVLNTQIGIISTLPSRKHEAFLSLKFNIDRNFNVNIEQGGGLLTGLNPSLDALRRAHLPKLWRQQYHLTD